MPPQTLVCQAVACPSPPTRWLRHVQELEERQREMAEQGNSMSDKRPVARLAEACSQLRTELLQMEVRTGILQAMLLRQATAKR